VFIPGGASSTRALARDASAVLFVPEADKHCKALAVSGTGRAVAEAAAIDMQDVLTSQNGVTPKMTEDFLQAVAQHRERTREAKAESVPA